MTKLDHPEWFFMWTSGTPYMTSLCAWTKRDLIKIVENSQRLTWKQIYRQGGRAVKVRMVKLAAPKGRRDD